MRSIECFALLGLVLGAIQSLQAQDGFDRIRLADGSEIVGKIVSMGGGQVAVETAFGVDEVVNISWDSVKGIESAGPLRVKGADGVVRSGSFAMGEGGPTFNGEPVDLSTLQGLNPDERPWFVVGSVNVGGSVADGNTQTKALSIFGDAVWTSGKHRVTGQGYYNYASNSTVGVTARNVRGSLKYDYSITDRLYTYANLFGEQDSFQDLNLRWAAGGGLGYFFVKPGDMQDTWFDAIEVSGEVGGAYLDEDFKLGGENQTLAARWSFRVEWPLMEGVHLFHNHEGYPSLEDVSDVYIFTQQGVRLQLYKGLQTTFQINWRWDNTPSPGFERSDTLYLWTLGYAFEL